MLSETGGEDSAGFTKWNNHFYEDLFIADHTHSQNAQKLCQGTQEDQQEAWEHKLLERE